MNKKSLFFICYFLSFLMSVFAAMNMVALIDILKKGIPSTYGEVITQASITLGIILFGLLFAQLTSNVQKGWVFVRKNQKLMLYYGIPILALNIPAYMGTPLFPSSMASVSANLLSIGGIFLVFFSIIFKIGIKIQEEQNFTI